MIAEDEISVPTLLFFIININYKGVCLPKSLLSDDYDCDDDSENDLPKEELDIFLHFCLSKLCHPG